MRSPLTTLLLVVLGWPLAILLVLIGYTQVSAWIEAEYPSPPPPGPVPAEISHPGYQVVTDNALRGLWSLEAAERRALLARLRAALVPAAQWLRQLDAAGFSVLCLGEDHAEATRRYLYRKLLPRLRYDRLLLEAPAAELSHIERRVAAGRNYFPLLGADIAGVLREANRRRPQVSIAGIDRTLAQAELAEPRDDILVRNFDSAFRRGERHVLLFGAFHCSDSPGWLFHQLRRQPPGPGPMLSLRLVEVHSDGPVEAFSRFLDAIELPADGFVVTRPERLPAPVLKWFALLRQSTLSRFDAVLIFRDRR